MKEKSNRVFQMRVSAKFLLELDYWRRSQDHPISRAKALRTLVTRAADECDEPGGVPAYLENYLNPEIIEILYAPGVKPPS
jgi:hypothetical protein